jgi:hypothetical protein
MGFGLGAFFFNFILVGIVNPDNAKQDSNHLFPQEIGDRLPLAFQVLGAVYAVIGLIGAFLTNPPIQESNQLEPTALLPK